MNRTTLLSLALLGGCASSSGPAVPAAQTQVSQVVTQQATAGTANVVSMTQSANAFDAEFAVAPETLWPKLIAAFKSIQLPATSTDEQARYLASSPAERTRRIDGKPVAIFFDCPGTAYGNSATTGNVFVTVQAQLLPTAKGSDLRIIAQANSMSEAGTKAQCASTGKLESRTVELLK